MERERRNPGSWQKRCHQRLALSKRMATSSSETGNVERDDQQEMYWNGGEVTRCHSSESQSSPGNQRHNLCRVGMGVGVLEEKGACLHVPRMEQCERH